MVKAIMKEINRGVAWKTNKDLNDEERKKKTQF